MHIIGGRLKILSLGTPVKEVGIKTIHSLLGIYIVASSRLYFKISSLSVFKNAARYPLLLAIDDNIFSSHFGNLLVSQHMYTVFRFISKIITSWAHSSAALRATVTKLVLFCLEMCKSKDRHWNRFCTTKTVENQVTLFLFSLRTFGLWTNKWHCTEKWHGDWHWLQIYLQ